MPTLVDDADVKEIMDSGIDFDTTPFILAADALVNAKLTGQGLSADHLFEIERWLSAHFVCIKSPGLLHEQVSKSSQTIESKLGLGLDVTRYGQQVKLLDTTGILASLGLKRASLKHIGGEEGYIET